MSGAGAWGNRLGLDDGFDLQRASQVGKAA